MIDIMQLRANLAALKMNLEQLSPAEEELFRPGLISAIAHLSRVCDLYEEFPKQRQNDNDFQSDRDKTETQLAILGDQGLRTL